MFECPIIHNFNKAMKEIFYIFIVVNVQLWMGVYLMKYVQELKDDFAKHLMSVP